MSYFDIERERMEADWPAETVFSVKCPAGHSYKTSVSIDGMCDTCEYEMYEDMMAAEEAEKSSHYEREEVERRREEERHEMDRSPSDPLGWYSPF